MLIPPPGSTDFEENTAVISQEKRRDVIKMKQLFQSYHKITKNGVKNFKKPQNI